MSLMHVYWITRLPALNDFFCVILCLSILLLAFIVLAVMFDDEIIRESTISMKKIVVGLVTIIVISTVLTLFIPTTKDLAAMYGINFMSKHIKESK